MERKRKVFFLSSSSSRGRFLFDSRGGFIFVERGVKLLGVVGKFEEQSLDKVGKVAWQLEFAGFRGEEECGNTSRLAFSDTSGILTDRYLVTNPGEYGWSFVCTQGYCNYNYSERIKKSGFDQVLLKFLFFFFEYYSYYYRFLF